MDDEEFARLLVQSQTPDAEEIAFWERFQSLTWQERFEAGAMTYHTDSRIARFLKAISSHGVDEQETASQLRKLIRSEGDLFYPAINVLTRIRPSETLKIATELLQSQSSEVRSSACWFLGHLPDSIAGEAVLLDHLAIETDPGVRCSVVDSLANAGSAKAIPILKKIAVDDPSTDYEGRPIAGLVKRAIKMIRSNMKTAKKPPEGGRRELSAD